ncbi:hypothetical protein TSUD_418830 [Trifolium subterraneum]|uniref:MADS-box domain-containing protein n=1 Tax=Trifolium subterraneum TaxID=3900 RepID=A0A1B5Z833_TRISU|nr:hypothetical protein TSUD_418830 [Trifolium subterraneum]
MSSGRKGQGRQKIDMKKMSNESNLQVTFSKRRSGLFKKASELCTLCGVDVALVVPSQNNDTMLFIEARRNANVNELNDQLTQINNTLDDVKKHGDELRHLHKEIKDLFWWACPIGGMNMDVPSQTHPFFAGNASSSNIHLYMSNPQQAQIFPPQLPQNHMLQSNLFGYNNIGGEYGIPEFF